MKIRDNILNLFKVSLVVLVTLFNVQAMANPSVATDISDDSEQHEETHVPETESTVEDNSEKSSEDQSADKD